VKTPGNQTPPTKEEIDEALALALKEHAGTHMLTFGEYRLVVRALIYLAPVFAARDEAVEIAHALANRDPADLECIICGGCLAERDHIRGSCPGIILRLDQLQAVGR